MTAIRPKTQTLTKLTAPYRNRTKTVPKKEKTYRTVRFLCVQNQ